MSSVPAVKNINKVAPRPPTFLCLAPETSASYPTAQDIKPALHPRRSSSVSSAGSVPSLRVLKLGPVHYGEHPDEHKEDFHEIARLTRDLAFPWQTGDPLELIHALSSKLGNVYLDTLPRSVSVHLLCQHLDHHTALV
ncbi:hypothetical protein RRF57_008371 [Xylaria bambusicola]|uniref:Uncharacterized protein n=1 Tax=Xylaria bambusicola TaxID=326684 RepID=A0AAN7Z6Z7_9PEZI